MQVALVFVVVVVVICVLGDEVVPCCPNPWTQVILLPQTPEWREYR
jgi:photosystem II stability/assembly factor-like uncharacterized protein